MKNTKFNAQYQPTAQPGQFRPEQAGNLAAAQQQADATYNRLQEMSERSVVQNARYVAQDAQNAVQTAGKDMQALSKLSGTLSKQLFDAQERKNEREMQEGIAEAYDYGVTEQELQEHRDGVTQLRQGEEFFQQAAGDVLKSGADYSVAEKAKNMSGWRQYGFAMGLAKKAGASYKDWMQDKIASVAGLPLAEQAAAMATFRNQFFSEFGLTGMNKVLLAEHAFPEMHAADTAIMGGIRKQYAIDRSLDDQSRARAEFDSTGDFGAYLTALSTTVDAEGNVLGYRGSWDMAMKNLMEDAKAGRLTETQLRNIERQEQGNTGKTFGQLHATKFKKLRDAMAAQRRTNWQNRQADMKMEREKAEQVFIDSLPDDYTDADIDAAEERLDQIMPGVDSKRLENLRKNSTVDAKVKERMRAELTALAESGQLTQEVLQDYPLQLQREFRDVAQKQGSSRAANGNYKPQFAAIKTAIENIPEVQAKIEGKVNYTVPLYIAAMEQKFSKLVAEGLAAGNPNAVADAQAQVIAEIQALEEGNGITNGQIDSMVAPNNPERTAQYAQKLNQWDTYIQSMGASAFDSPGAFFDTSELKAMEKGYGKPGWEVPAGVQYLANKTGMSALEIINRQRAAAAANGAEDMLPLPPPASLEYAATQVNPAYQKLLNTYQSPERSIRGLGSSYKFDPSVIPHGYGDAIQKAADATGIDPSIIAGLIETESSWNAGARSGAGAVGLMQIVPRWHPTHQPGVDPAADIMYGANYLKQLLDQFGGDMRLALTAYNAGPGAVQQYGGPIPGNRESMEYAGKVMKGATKYGYGQVSYRMPETMRPSMAGRTLAYTSGNIGPTSTGAHLDVKRTDGSYFEYKDLDNFVEVDDPELGTVPLGSVPQTGDWASHTRRGSHGRDYGLYAGTPIYIKNGAVVVSKGVGYEHGDNTVIRLPDGREFRFLHGTAS